MLPPFLTFFTAILHSISFAFETINYYLPAHHFSFLIASLLHLFDIVIFISISTALEKHYHEILLFVFRKYLIYSSNNLFYALFTSTLWYAAYMAPFTTFSFKLLAFSIATVLWLLDYCSLSCFLYVGLSAFYKKYAKGLDPLNEKMLWFEVSFLLFFLDREFWFVGMGIAAGLSMTYRFESLEANRNQKFNYYIFVVVSVVWGYGEVEKVLLEIAKVGLITAINQLGSTFFVRKKAKENYIPLTIFPLLDQKKLMKPDSLLENNSKSLLRVLLQGNHCICAVLVVFFEDNSTIMLGIWAINSFLFITQISYLNLNIRIHLILVCLLAVSVELLGALTVE